jgi:hypothetical protein
VHNEELLGSYRSQNIMSDKSRRIRWAGHVAHRGEKKYSYWVLVRQHKKKKAYGRPKQG